MKKLAIFTFLLFITSNALACEKVIKIIDGDTIETSITGRIRILGIDSFDKIASRVQKQAKRTGFSNKDILHLREVGKDFATETLANKCIQLETDYKDTDIYGRKLRYIIVEGVDYSLSIIKQGLAIPYCEDKKVKNFKKYNEASLWKCK
jgi:endonuclease YncB( thermonuclease family)